MMSPEDQVFAVVAVKEGLIGKLQKAALLRVAATRPIKDKLNKQRKYKRNKKDKTDK